MTDPRYQIGHPGAFCFDFRRRVLPIPFQTCRSRDLYRAYLTWCRGYGLDSVSKRAFGLEAKKFFRPRKVNFARLYEVDQAFSIFQNSLDQFRREVDLFEGGVTNVGFQGGETGSVHLQGQSAPGDRGAQRA